MREVWLFFHFVGLSMGVGTAFAQLFRAISVSKLSIEEMAESLMKNLVLIRMGNIGIAIMVISGYFLLKPQWDSLSTNFYLIIKLVLVGVLFIVLIFINVVRIKYYKTKDIANLFKIKKLGQFTLPLSLVIIALAISVFH